MRNVMIRSCFVFWEVFQESLSCSLLRSGVFCFLSECQKIFGLMMDRVLGIGGIWEGIESVGFTLNNFGNKIVTVYVIFLCLR